MGAHDGTIDEQVFHVWIVNEMLMHPFPDSLITPASEALIDAIPVAVAFWQKSPLGTAAGHPEHCFDKPAAVAFLTNVHLWAGTQKLKDFQPLVVS